MNHRPGIFLVVWGMVRGVVDVGQGQDAEFYMGTGGAIGLMASVIGAYVPGIMAKSVFAEGNAMGRGPIILHIPW